MPSYDPDRHHRRSIRLPGYDYTQPGAYFVTIVTHRRAHVFGEAVNGDMRLNAWGDIVRDEWFKTARIRPYVQLRDDEFVVMPNHIHGIIWIVGSPDIVGATRRVAPTMGDPIPPGVPVPPGGVPVPPGGVPVPPGVAPVPPGGVPVPPAVPVPPGVAPVPPGGVPVPPAVPTDPREVADDDMRLNAWGDIVRDEWFKTAHIRPYVQLRDDEFVVMPNHIHGIIWIVGSPDIVGATRRVAPTMGDPIPPGVPTNPSGATPIPPAAPTEPRGPIPQSIGAIIGQFKSIVTKRIHASHGVSGTPIWQRNYYEHIIRHERALNAIRRYIINNPRRWHLDRENARRTGSDPLAREIWAMLQEDDQRHVAEGGQ